MGLFKKVQNQLIQVSHDLQRFDQTRSKTDGKILTENFNKLCEDVDHGVRVEEFKNSKSCSRTGCTSPLDYNHGTIYYMDGLPYHENCRRDEIWSKTGRVRCQKCSGSGKISVKYDAYPKGLPDSGWATDYQWKDVKCDECKGEGSRKGKYITETKTITKFIPED